MLPALLQKHLQQHTADAAARNGKLFTLQCIFVLFMFEQLVLLCTVQIISICFYVPLSTSSVLIVGAR